MNISQLNKQFKNNPQISFFVQGNDIIIANISNEFATCKISLYGAHILSFIPKGETDLLWMSQNSFLAEGKAIRGGIPICFPWFGPHASDKDLPQHGCARLMYWNLTEVIVGNDNTTKVVLSCESNKFTSKFWPFRFALNLIVTIGRQLEISLECCNLDNKEFKYTDALHTYFNISDVSNICLHGLQSANYHNGLQADMVSIQSEELLYFTQEENRRYIGHSGECIITDKGLNRKIFVRKRNSNTTVVWNPWEATSRQMADMTPEGYKTMVCVEAVNAYDDFVFLKPGETHVLQCILGIL